MNCDDVMSSYVTGNWFQRWSARRHARGCPRCASALQSLHELLRQAQSHPPLSERQRQAWLNVTEVSQAPASYVRKDVWTWGIALAAAVLVALTLFLFRAEQPPRARLVPQQVAERVFSPIRRVDVTDEFVRLDAQSEQLAGQLELTSHDVDRVAALNETTRLIAQFKPW